MKWFHDLVVHGNSDALEKLIAAIEARLGPNWHRDLETESRVAGCAGHRRYFIQCCRLSGDIGFELARYPDVISVDNVFGYSGKCLLASDYSELLEDFFWRFVKPAADRLSLKSFSTGFEDRCPQWAKRRRRLSAIEIALGFRVAVRLREEGYVGRFPVRSDIARVPIDQPSIALRLLERGRSPKVGSRYRHPCVNASRHVTP